MRGPYGPRIVMLREHFIAIAQGAGNLVCQFHELVCLLAVVLVDLIHSFQKIHQHTTDELI